MPRVSTGQLSSERHLLPQRSPPLWRRDQRPAIPASMEPIHVKLTPPEDPARSLHWELPQEKQMMETGLWFDTEYAACVFGSARAKAQRLRHNIPEIEAWGPLQCHHVHADNEWTLTQVDGVTIYPAAEEAEYSASLVFAVAISVSWWAARNGHAVMAIPRLPTVACVGQRASQHAPMGHCTTGNFPWIGSSSSSRIARVPRRWRVADVIENGALPAHCVYVGPTATGCAERSGRHRTNGSQDISTGSWQTTPTPCTSSKACRPQAEAPHSGPDLRARPQRKVSIFSRVSAGLTVPRQVWGFSQEEAILSFRKLFPYEWFVRVQLPFHRRLNQHRCLHGLHALA